MGFYEGGRDCSGGCPSDSPKGFDENLVLDSGEIGVYSGTENSQMSTYLLTYSYTEAFMYSLTYSLTHSLT